VSAQAQQLIDAVAGRAIGDVEHVGNRTSSRLISYSINESIVNWPSGWPPSSR
jgi:hypothetical protein